MVTAEATSHTFTFDPRYKKQILNLAKHREPGYPSFVTLELVSEQGESAWATMWYVGRPENADSRYHVQFAGESKVLRAAMDASQRTLKIMEK